MRYWPMAVGRRISQSTWTTHTADAGTSARLKGPAKEDRLAKLSAPQVSSFKRDDFIFVFRSCFSFSRRHTPAPRFKKVYVAAKEKVTKSARKSARCF